MSHPHAECKIVIHGSFDVIWTEYVGEMLVHVQVQEGQIQTTTLFGQPIDLAAFLGTLHMLVDLNFPIIGFEYRQADPIELTTACNFDRAELISPVESTK